MRGRKPIDPEKQEASGAYRKDPQRRKPPPPKSPKGWPDKPEFIAADSIANERWEEDGAKLNAMGLLTTADQLPLSLYCSAYANWRRAETMMEPVLALKYWDRVLKMANEIGLTQSSRIRFHIVDEEEEDDFQTWLAGGVVDN